MKAYPSISGEIRTGEGVYVFDKLDGSNIRAEWEPKKGFWKFGRRNGLLDHTNPTLLAAPAIIQAKYGDELSRIFKKERWQRVVAFFEFHGPLSFAGNHVEGDAHTVTLFDVAVDKKGILHPRDFVRAFGSVETARLLHQGNFTFPMREQVRDGSFPGMTFEGVICKGGYVSPGMPLMFKVKSQAWVERLRTHCGTNDRLFQQLL